MKKTSVLFCCMGNICRSPTAEGVFRDKVRAAGLDAIIVIDSAGTHDYHVGRPPDERAAETARQRGYDLSSLRARQVCATDFTAFDYILAMDQDNLDGLLQRCPGDQRHKLRLFLSFSQHFAGQEVPDPYYGGRNGFETVLDMVEDAAQGLLDHLRQQT